MEVILVDDASTDETRALYESLIADALSVRLCVMKTLFIEPPYQSGYEVLRDQAGKFGAKISPGTVFPPLDFAFSAAVLEKNGYEFEIIDAPALNLDVQRVLKNVSKDEPRLIVVNTSAVSLTNDLKIACLIKERSPNSWVCVTGSLLSVMPEVALSNSKIDIVVRSEIEDTIVELLKALDDRRLQDVKGIAYKKDGTIVKNPDRPLNLNFDGLPFPAYHHLPVDRYYYHLLPRRPFVTMLTSKGCPYGCIYCPYPIGFGNVWRGRSSKKVVDEIQYLADRFNVKSILFRDQVFTYDMKRTEEICKGIVDRGVDISWRCETRVDKLSEKLMLKMKEAGCVGLHMGVESGNPKILSTVAKRGLNLDMAKKIFAKAKDIGIETFAFFMVGLPGETKQSIWQSYKLAREINPDIIQFTVLTPYPGTKLFDIAEKKGWILTRDWSKYTGFDVVMRTDELSEQDIRRAQYYLKACLTFSENKHLENTAHRWEGILNMLPLSLSRLAKKFSSAMGYYLRRDAEKQFEWWVLQS